MWFPDVLIHMLLLKCLPLTIDSRYHCGSASFCRKGAEEQRSQLLRLGDHPLFIVFPESVFISAPDLFWQHPRLQQMQSPLLSQQCLWEWGDSFFLAHWNFKCRSGECQIALFSPALLFPFSFLQPLAYLCHSSWKHGCIFLGDDLWNKNNVQMNEPQRINETRCIPMKDLQDS